MSKDKVEAFVYIWRDSSRKKFYIGYHKGTVDDNYAHSSSLMESFSMNSVPAGYKRKILAQGSSEEMIELEQKLLENRKERRWDKYHNIMTGPFPYPWDDEEYRKNHIRTSKARWEDEEYRKMVTCGRHIAVHGRVDGIPSRCAEETAA